jgi:hypothetical protein
VLIRHDRDIRSIRSRTEHPHDPARRQRPIDRQSRHLALPVESVLASLEGSGRNTVTGPQPP